MKRKTSFYAFRLLAAGCALFVATDAARALAQDAAGQQLLGGPSATPIASTPAAFGAPAAGGGSSSGAVLGPQGGAGAGGSAPALPTMGAPSAPSPTAQERGMLGEAQPADPVPVSGAATTLGDNNALPSSDGVNPRAPGLQLTTDNAPPAVDPFAPAVTQTKSPEEVEAEIRDRAYNAALTGLLPLRPAEIRKLLETYDKTQQAVEVPIYPYPEPQIVVQNVSLDPGVKPIEIKVATGHVTTLNILDLTGSPWPVQDISWAGNFEIVQPEAGGHVMRITPMSEFAYGNMSIRLVNLDTPITFIIKTHRDVVQYRVDAKVPEYGPGFKAPIIEGGTSIAAGNATLGSILDGVPPEGAERLDVEGVDGRTTAYRINDLAYVRTPLTLLSPGWSSSVSSGDGMNVYELRDAPVLLLSDEGSVVRARLTERDTSL